MQIALLQRAPGQNTVEYAVYLNDTAKRYTLARYRADDIYAQPRHARLDARRWRGGGRGGGGGGGRGGAGGGSAPVQLSADGTSVFFQGTANDKNPHQVAPKTFIDQITIKTGEKKRIYESDNNDVSERVSTVLDPDAKTFIVARESPSEVPQHFLLDGGRRSADEEQRSHPDLTTRQGRAPSSSSAPTASSSASRSRCRQTTRPARGCRRCSGSTRASSRTRRTTTGRIARSTRTAFPTSARARWSTSSASATPSSANDAPIVGPQGQMNNNYVNDLRNNLAATIDELDRRQLVDRQRLAIGGHSYGAFSTVNAMVHTPFFKAGIAGDGAYNRTLTPIGFQTERRDLWEAPNVYLGMSPFLYANNLTGALLMYHNLATRTSAPIRPTRSACTTR